MKPGTRNPLQTPSMLLLIRHTLVLMSLWSLSIRPQGVGAAEHCVYTDMHTAANCSNANLDDVPWDLHTSINALDLSGNKLAVLENNLFVRYKSISKLHLRKNTMSVIKARAFAQLDYLKELDLSNNQLAHVPVEALDVVAESLFQLILAGNKLSVIQRGTFSRLKHLRHLDLSGNSIYRVEPGAFDKLFSLTVFKLRHNAIKRLPENSFKDFPRESMTQVQLYHNRWVCDCHSRWLWRWLNETDPYKWEAPGYPIRCEGPAIVRDEALDALPLERLVCRAKMKISGSSRELAQGANTTLQCRYWTVPATSAFWLKNSERIDEKRHDKKYEVSSWEVRGKNDTYASELTIRDFKYADIAKYTCVIENIRGVADAVYKLTLKGVDFESVVAVKPVGHKAGDSEEVDIRSIIIAVAVVFGIILIVVIAVLIFCSVNRMQRKKQAKRDVIVQHVTEHFIKNSEDNTAGDSTDKCKGSPLTRGLDDGMGGKAFPGQEDIRSNSNHTNDSTYKPPLGLEEAEPMLLTSGHSPGSPLNNGNTYVSFDSAFAEPAADYPYPYPYPQGDPAYHPHAQQPPPLPPGNRYGGVTGGVPGGAGSQEGSATPLLDRFTPVFVDELDEPVEEDYSSYPVYDSHTNSLQHSRLTPPLLNGANLSAYNYSNGGGGLPLYGTSPIHHHRQPGGGSVSSNSNRNGGGGGGLLDRSQGSIYYPHSNSAGSLPRTPGSVRSMAGAPPPPWNPAGFGDGDGSPPIIENHYYPPPLVHRPHPEYRDYRDMRYPPTTSTPPANRSVAQAKTMGYSPIPASVPRKPPRVYIPGSGGANGREVMELAPHDPASDYITSAEAQQYSQNYGITPGTPV